MPENTEAGTASDRRLSTTTSTISTKVISLSLKSLFSEKRLNDARFSERGGVLVNCRCEQQ